MLPAAYLDTEGKEFVGDMDLLVRDDVGLFNELYCWTGFEEESFGWNKFSPIRSLLAFL